MIVYLARDIPAFVMYCVNRESGSSLLIEYTDSLMPGLNACGLQSKLLITQLSEGSHNIFFIVLQVWCSLKSVTITLGLLFRWLHILHCTVVITLGNLASFPSYSRLVYMIL